jgi:hypothetical protein
MTAFDPNGYAVEFVLGKRGKKLWQRTEDFQDDLSIAARDEFGVSAPLEQACCAACSCAGRNTEDSWETDGSDEKCAAE